MADPKLLALAQEVLSIGRGRLTARLRFLSRALFALSPSPTEDVSLATDGRALFFHPLSVVRGYRREVFFAQRLWLHMVLHAVFQHMFIDPAIDQVLWNAACDLAVEHIIAGLRLSAVPSAEDAQREKVFSQLSQDVRPMTAEKLYRHLLTHTPDMGTLSDWRRLFELDNHDLWYEVKERELALKPADELKLNRPLTEAGDAMKLRSPDGDGDAGAASLLLRAQWQRLSRSMLTDLESFSREQGSHCGHLLQALRTLHRERADYAAFLRKFAVSTEVMKLSPDEFDLVYYTYGLRLYEDMPLIEPLESRDDRRIRDFVIAIDTSGSVRGELVEKFVQKTFAVLKQQETYDTRFEIRLIQCDADIQEEAVLRSKQDVDAFLSRMTLRGFGGTDFRPVFERVDALRRQGALPDLRGLLYFTDGFGAFPERPPDYRAAFVFVTDDGLCPKELPPWAIRLALTRDEVTQL